MSYNAVLTDKKDEQVLPITTAENVFYNGSKTVREVIDDIIEGNFKTEGMDATYSHNRIETEGTFPTVNLNVTPTT